MNLVKERQELRKIKEVDIKNYRAEDLGGLSRNCYSFKSSKVLQL